MKTLIIKTFIVLSVLFGICIVISFPSCKSPPPVVSLPPPEPEPVLPEAPVFSLQDIRVENISKNMVELFVSVNLENPNNFELPQPRLAFDYQVYETTLVRSRLRNNGALPPSSVTPVVFGIVVYYDDLFLVFPEVQRARIRDVPSVLKLTCDLDIPVIDDKPTDLKVNYTLPIRW